MSRLGAWSKSGITPAGGLIAGPSSSVRSSAWTGVGEVRAVESVILMDSRVSGRSEAGVVTKESTPLNQYSPTFATLDRLSILHPRGEI